MCPEILCDSSRHIVMPARLVELKILPGEEAATESHKRFLRQHQRQRRNMDLHDRSQHVLLVVLRLCLNSLCAKESTYFSTEMSTVASPVCAPTVVVQPGLAAIWALAAAVSKRGVCTCSAVVLLMPGICLEIRVLFVFDCVRRKENTKKLKSKLLNIKLRKEMMTRQKIVALMMKAVMVRAQNLKMMWTVE